MKTKFAAAMMITVTAGSLMAVSAGAEEVLAARGPGRYGPPPRHEWREPQGHREWREPPPPQHSDRRPPHHEWREPGPPHDGFRKAPPLGDRPEFGHQPRREFRGAPPRH